MFAVSDEMGRQQLEEVKVMPVLLSSLGNLDDGVCLGIRNTDRGIESICRQKISEVFFPFLKKKLKVEMSLLLCCTMSFIAIQFIQFSIRGTRPPQHCNAMIWSRNTFYGSME